MSELDEETAEAFLKNQDKFHVYQSVESLAKLLKIFRECDSETLERLATLPNVLFDGLYYDDKVRVYETLKECDDRRLSLIVDYAPHFFKKKPYGKSLEASLRIVKSLVDFDEGLFPLVKEHLDDLLTLDIYRDTLFESIKSFDPDVFQLFFHNRHKLLPERRSQDSLERLSSFTRQNMDDALKYLDIKDENYCSLLKVFKNIPSKAIPLFLELSRFVTVYNWDELSQFLSHEQRDFEASRQQIPLIFKAVSQYSKNFETLKKILDLSPEAMKAISENAEAFFGHIDTEFVLDFLKNETADVIQFFARQMPFIVKKDQYCQSLDEKLEKLKEIYDSLKINADTFCEYSKDILKSYDRVEVLSYLVQMSEETLKAVAENKETLFSRGNF